MKNFKIIILFTFILPLKSYSTPLTEANYKSNLSSEAVSYDPTSSQDQKRIEIPEIRNLPKGVKEAIEKIFNEKRPQYIVNLEQKIKSDTNYYESLSTKKAQMPCGTSKGYILNNSFELIEGFYSILANEFSLKGGAEKYHEMIRPVVDSKVENTKASQALTKLLEVIWSGKLIKKTNNPCKNYLINNLFTSTNGKKAFEAEVYHLDSATINIDYSISSYQIIRNIRDEIRQVSDTLYLGKAFYKGTHSEKESLFLYFALDFSQSPSCEKTTEAIKTDQVELSVNYKNLKSCEKMNLLWDDYIMSSKYKILPKLDDADAFGLFSLTLTNQMKDKMDYTSDVVPKGWVKPIHSRGSMAKIRFKSSKEHPFTGLYNQSSCALIRLSLTNNPHQKHILKPGQKRGVAPGIALKFFVDEKPSQDLSLLTTLEGQGNNHNFFLETFFSSIIPIGSGFDMKVVHTLFETVSKYPERLSVSGMSEWTLHGENVSKPVSPTQLFFVPAYQASEKEEDIREKFHRIPRGTTLFHVYGYVSKSPKEDYKNYSKQQGFKFLDKSFHIGEIITESEFISSAFGDHDIFFKHKMFESDYQKK